MEVVVVFFSDPSRSDIILANFTISPKQWFSKCIPRITWEIIRNANAWAPCQTYKLRNSGSGVQAAVL